MLRNLIVRVGNGTKTHFGYSREIRGREITFLSCGTKSLKGLSVLGVFSLDSYQVEGNTCEKCLQSAKQEQAGN
jgi:hypothetical protein